MIGKVQMEAGAPHPRMRLGRLALSRHAPNAVSFVLGAASIFGRPRETGGLVGSLGVSADPSIYPEARYILYQVLIRNASSQPMINARIMPRIVKGDLIVKDAPKIIPKLNANSSGTATFTLEPTGEVGLAEVEGFLSFARERMTNPVQLKLQPVSFDFTLKPLVHVKLTQQDWKERVSRYFSDEESFVSPRSAEEILEAASRVLRNVGLAYITRFKAEEGFAAERRDFYAVDTRGHGFAARILWRYPFSKDSPPTLLVRVFAETEDGLFAFCHRVMRRLELELQPAQPESHTVTPGGDQPPF